MGERINISILVIFVIAVGFVSAYFSIFNHDFTFYSAEINANGNNISENLFYIPNQNLHTLFRNFDSPIVSKQIAGIESIKMLGVSCLEGTAYAKQNGRCLESTTGEYSLDCMDYTENNEYGCSFGDYRGFSTGKEYFIEGNYTVEPPQLFEFEGKHYIKFIAYDERKHPDMVLNKNLFVSGAVAKERYKPNEKVILYVNYEPENINLYKVEKVNGLDFDDKTGQIIVLFLFSAIPGIYLFIIWYFFGKENTNPNIPDELSDWPEDRKPWEVASFFAMNNGNVIPSTILDFYRRKIIDIKTEKKQGLFGETTKTYIKILKESGLDEIEKTVMRILKIAFEMDSEEKDGYFNLDSVKSSSWGNIGKKWELQVQGRLLLSMLRKAREEISSYVGVILAFIGIVVVGYLSFIFTQSFTILGIFIACFIIFIIGLANKTLFLKFKGNYYEEYIKWKSFKKYLKYSYSMKESEVQGIIIWNQYLVYATALGVSNKILKRLKKEGIITDDQYKTYNHIGMSFAGFATSSGAGGGHGGGGGGAGGGGAGGGGGGGR